jgi:hypothetical protein
MNYTIIPTSRYIGVACPKYGSLFWFSFEELWNHFCALESENFKEMHAAE